MTEDNKFASDKLSVSRRKFVLGSAAVMAAIALPGCASKVANSTTTIPVSPESTSKLTPKRGGTLRRLFGTMSANHGWPADPTIDMGSAQLSLETLLRGDNKGNIIPWLAESYKLADDRKSITFNLRKGVKFHDQSDFNAAAAKWNLENFIAAKLQPNWASVDVLNDSTIRVNFTQWQNTLLSTFVEPTFPAFMVSKAAFDKNGQDWMRQHPVGTGPFIFDSFVVDASYKVKRNPDYWVSGKPYLDGIDYTLIGDTITRKMAMKAGEGDMVDATARDMADYAASGFVVKVLPVTDGDALFPDSANADSPWANQKVREAVEYAIDKEKIAKVFGYGYWQAPDQIVPPACTLVYDKQFALGRKYNLDKAKQLMTEAGYAKGFQTTFIAQLNKDVLLAIQGDLAKINIKVDLEFPDMAKFISYMDPKAKWHNAAVYYGISAISGVDFAAGLNFLFSNHGQSWAKPPELNEAYQAFLSSPTVEPAKVRAVTDIITKDALIIPTDFGATGNAMKKEVMANWGERSNQLLVNAEDWWLNR